MPEQAEEPKDDGARKLAILEKHCIQLSEHFDSVQIIATQFCPDTGTRIISKGIGNWYANFGAVSEWVDGARGVVRRPDEDS